VNNREKNFTHERLKRRLAAIDEGIARYLAGLDREDRQAAVTGVLAPASKAAELTGRIEKLKARMQSLAALEARLVASGDNQISLTDPDARAMTSKSHSAYTVGYNVQSAVDTKHHLIVAHEVTNIGIDMDQLSPMAEQAREAMEAEAFEVLADKGYYNGVEIAACEDAGIEVYVPKRATSNARAQGRFDKDEFIYDPGNDCYMCPAGQQLTRRMTVEEKGRAMHVYWTDRCGDCPLKRDCTTGKQRRVRRWEKEDVLERAQARLDGFPGAMQQRRETAEHPFGTLKAWMGATHFKMKTLAHVATEMALHVLAYNIKRVIAILGVPKLVEVICAFISLLAAAIWHGWGGWMAQKPSCAACA